MGVEAREGAPVFGKETAAAGGLARAAALSPGRRKNIARQAAYSRWYRIGADDMVRCEALLKQLARIVTRALMEGNDDRAIRAIAAMGPYEKYRLFLRTAGGKAGELPEIDSETERRLRESREKRALALGAVVEAEVVKEEGK